MLLRIEAQTGKAISPMARSRLGHRRLSIIDLTDAARQPMATPDGRYRHHLQRRDLQFPGAEGRAVRRAGICSSPPATARCCWPLSLSGGSTRSTLEWHVRFCIWDQRERTLTLARDRFGVKPLYYAQVNDAFLFGSEIKAFRVSPALRARLDVEGLAEYLTFPEFLHRSHACSTACGFCRRAAICRSRSTRPARHDPAAIGTFISRNRKGRSTRASRNRGTRLSFQPGGQPPAGQ